jgi:hypothetical protein
VHNLLEEYDISLDELEDHKIEYMQTEINDHNPKKIVNRVLNENKYKYRPSLNKSDLIDNVQKLSVEKNDHIVKSANSKSHSRRISTAAEIYSFGHEIKAFRKQKNKIDEKSEKEETDNISPKKKGLTRKSAIEPTITNALAKKNNFSRRLTANNIKKNKKDNSNHLLIQKRMN